MRSKLLMGLLVIALLCAVGWKAHSQDNPLKQTVFEYHVIDDPTQTGSFEEGIKRLNQLGAAGWEITGVSSGKDRPAKLYLKRRLI